MKKGIGWYVLNVLLLWALSSPGLAKVDPAKDLGILHLSEAQIVAGLKEALQVGAKNAVNLTGRVDGYFANPAIKIPMPEKLVKIESWLRKVGYGNQVDEFIVSMNRAAEQAAPAAKEIFWSAIREMSFEDARKILSGKNETAATEYFQLKTSSKLTAAFQPVVTQKTNEVGVTRRYKELVSKARSIPFFKVELVDIDQYVVGKALDGLFHMVGEEEKKIRKDPPARVTKLLKKVFGGRE